MFLSPLSRLFSVRLVSTHNPLCSCSFWLSAEEHKMPYNSFWIANLVDKACLDFFIVIISLFILLYCSLFASLIKNVPLWGFTAFKTIPRPGYPITAITNAERSEIASKSERRFKGISRIFPPFYSLSNFRNAVVPINDLGIEILGHISTGM